MPRTKGSKNKSTALSVEEQMTKVNAEIAEMQTALRKKKAELKKLAEQQKLADQQKLLDAVASSGKSLEEVLSLLNSK